MTIHTADDLFTIWAEYSATGGAPVGVVAPDGYDTTCDLDGPTDEQQAVRLVDRFLKDFPAAYRGLYSVYIEHFTPDSLNKPDRKALEELSDAVTDFIGRGWRTDPRKSREAPCEKDEIDAITAAVNEAAEGKFPLRWRQRIKERRSAA